LQASQENIIARSDVVVNIIIRYVLKNEELGMREKRIVFIAASDVLIDRLSIYF